MHLVGTENKVVGCIIWFDPEKLLQKVSQRYIVVYGVLNNISKVYQNLTMQKVLFSRWRPRWPPNL